MTEIVKPSVGRVLHYRLSESDVEHIKAVREASGGKTYGNTPEVGEVVPLHVCRVWDGEHPSVNGQALLDGNDTLWKTSCAQGTGPGTWSWPART